MSLHPTLEAIVVVILGVLLLPAFIAMGPLAWVVLGGMLLIGIVQVHRGRDRNEKGVERPTHCPNCGVRIDAYAEEYERRDDSQWQVQYCPDCGAPLAPETGKEPRPSRGNCPDCGAVVDPADSECDYCHAEL